MSEADTAEITEALTAARQAYAAARQALARAESAARQAGVTDAGSSEPIDELRVQRIRVVEPDGTTRILIGNSTMADIAPFRGEDRDHPGRDDFGGILFCNDEGTEAGGLLYAGGVVDGEPQQIGFWTVDDFEQNEGFRLGAAQTGQTRTKWIEFADQPYFSLGDYMDAAKDKTGDELTQVQQQFWPPNVDGNGITRLQLSKEAYGTVGLSLRDADGVERIRLAVTADGAATITGTDADDTPRSLLATNPDAHN